MIYKTNEGGYVASSNNMWIHGCFEDERTAKYAFKFKNEQLQKLQDEKNKTTRIITFKDLQDLRRLLNAT